MPDVQSHVPSTLVLVHSQQNKSDLTLAHGCDEACCAQRPPSLLSDCTPQSSLSESTTMSTRLRRFALCFEHQG
jgi:hypothetical protein